MGADQSFNRAISAACRNDALADLLLLLEGRPSALHMQTPFGSLLHIAASSGSSRVVTYLLSQGADPNARGGTFNGSPLNSAASNGHESIVLELLRSGATMDTSEPERNPLFGAVYGGHLQVVKLLVSSGIDFRVKYTGPSMKDMNASAFAVERGQSEIAKYLRALENAA